MQRVTAGVSILVLLALLVGSLGVASAAAPVRLVAEYPLPGSPYRVAVEGAGRIWVTMPARNSIGRPS
jgi:streptogramin lyase